jgi:hydroxymethylpyrimidine/phosphomethylpyrimidine kinase
MPSPTLPCALSIAGSDSGGGAGIQADLLSFAANEVYGTTAITCLTAQNPNGVSAVFPAPPEFVAEQIHQVSRFYHVNAAKTGMLFDEGLSRAVSTAVAAYPKMLLVVDPVMVASSGARLLKPEAVQALVQHLIPLATVITPNLDEAEILLGRRPRETEIGRMADAAELAQKLHTAVILKGGHAQGDDLVDLLVDANGRVLATCRARRVTEVDTHGSGCTLSAAITARLARGEDLTEAFNQAHAYLQGGLRAAISIGARRQIGH